MSRQEVLEKIHELDSFLLLLAGEELRASRNHFPGEHQERYRDLRRQAKYVHKLQMDWVNIMPPAPIFIDPQTRKVLPMEDQIRLRDALPLRVK